MKNDRIEQESWYAPLKQSGKQAKPQKRKYNTAWRAAGIICILLVLIVASSLAFSKSNDSSAPPMADGEMPEDWRDFFKYYYQDPEDDKTEIFMQTTEYEGSFTLTSEEPDGEELSLQELYKDCADPIVAIMGSFDKDDMYSWGTGVILSEDGLILTNAHVLDGCVSASVIMADDSEYEARLVGVDDLSDLAVLKINASGLPAAHFGDSTKLSVGDKVAAIGNPLNIAFRQTMTDGIISSIERGVDVNGRSTTLLQTNTAINQGSSGGALFNMYGQVIGITNMKMVSAYGYIEGMGFAIPTSTVLPVVNALLRDGEVRGRTSIGIMAGNIAKEAAEYYELPEGVYVSGVMPNSDAERKGIQEGDIILAIDSVEVKTSQEVLDMKEGHKVGDTMTFTIWRDGKVFDVEIELVDTNDLS